MKISHPILLLLFTDLEGFRSFAFRACPSYIRRGFDVHQKHQRRPVTLRATTEQEQDEGSTTATAEKKNADGIVVNGDADLRSAASFESSSSSSSDDGAEAEGLPWWWSLIWDLDIMKTGEPGEDIIFGDSANVLRTNIEQIYGGAPSLDGCPLAEGEITDIADGTMFIGLQQYNQKYGSPYKLCFGPKSFLVISDPVQAKHVLRDANTNYDKGMLGELLDPIMGKGLIPAGTLHFLCSAQPPRTVAAARHTHPFFF